MLCYSCVSHMDSQVARLQPEGVLRNQSVPPLLPAYNMFMGTYCRQIELTNLGKRMASIGNLGVFGCVSSSSCLTMLLIMPTYFTSIAANDMTLDPRICLHFAWS